MKGSCDLLWLRTWGRRDGMPVPNLGFRRPCVFPLSFCHHCVTKPRLARCMMRSTSPWHPADSQQTASMGVRPSKTSQPPTCHLTADSWASSVEIRQSWATSTELPSWSVDSWAVLKAYCLKSLGFEVVCHGATASCYSPYVLVLRYLSCYSDAHNSLLLNKPLC